MIGIKDQCFGVEVEMTGITREQAARALADYFGAGTSGAGVYLFKNTEYEQDQAEKE